MGLGEAMRRLLDIEIRYRHGGATEDLARERNLLLQALNRVEIQLGFDCDRDGVADTVEIFQQAAETSCCRITDLSGVTPVKSAPTLEKLPPKIRGERWTTEPSRVPGDAASRIVPPAIVPPATVPPVTAPATEDKPKPGGLLNRLFGNAPDKDTKK